MSVELKRRASLGACVVMLCVFVGCGLGGGDVSLNDGGTSADGGLASGNVDGGEDSDREPERAPWHPPEGSTFGARILPPEVDHPTRKVGEACSTYGASDCHGGTCLKVAPLPNPLQVCTRACDSHSECPADWTCTSVRPGAKALCTPSLEVARRLRKQSTGDGR